jgi:hypothetical protein
MYSLLYGVIYWLECKDYIQIKIYRATILYLHQGLLNSGTGLRQPAACSFGWLLVAGADFFWEKSTAGWLLVAGLFWEKNTIGWWLISQANRAQGRTQPETPKGDYTGGREPCSILAAVRTSEQVGKGPTAARSAAYRGEGPELRTLYTLYNYRFERTAGGPKARRPWSSASAGWAEVHGSIWQLSLVKQNTLAEHLTNASTICISRCCRFCPGSGQSLGPPLERTTWNH